MLVSGLLLRSLGIRLCLVRGQLFLALLLLSLGLFTLRGLLNFLLLGLFSFLVCGLFLPEAVCKTGVAVFPGVCGLQFG